MKLSEMKGLTDREQCALEAEWDRQSDGEELDEDVIRFDANLDPKGPWRIFAVNDNAALRLPVTVPYYTKREEVIFMIRAGRFDKYVSHQPDAWRVEKW